MFVKYKETYTLSIKLKYVYLYSLCFYFSIWFSLSKKEKEKKESTQNTYNPSIGVQDFKKNANLSSNRAKNKKIIIHQRSFTYILIISILSILIKL